MNRIWKMLGGVCVIALAVTACAGNGVKVGGTASGGDGTLKAAILSEPDSLDPHNTTNASSFAVLDQVYDTLVQTNAQGKTVPDLATNWISSADQLTWTFTLRAAKWQDGTPFTSADVVYSYDRLLNTKTDSSSKLATVRSVTADGPNKVVLTLKQPTPNLLTNLGGASRFTAILEKSNVDSGKIKSSPVGTGPFSFVSWHHGDFIQLKANPYYWGPKPKLGTIKFVFVSNPTVAGQNLESGDVQWTNNVPPNLSKGGVSGINVSNIAAGTYEYLNFNEHIKPFDDPRVRQAIAYAIDRKAIVVAATSPTVGAVNQTAIPKASPWYYDYAPYTYDPSKAQSLLAAAGVHNLTVNFMTDSDLPAFVRIAQVVADELKAVGINTKINTVDTATFISNETTRSWDVYVLGWGANIDPVDYYYAEQHTGGSFNWQGYSNPTTDNYLDEAGKEPDMARRKDLYDHAVKQIVDDASYVYLYNDESVEAWSTKVHGYTARSDGAVSFAAVSLS